MAAPEGPGPCPRVRAALQPRAGQAGRNRYKVLIQCCSNSCTAGFLAITNQLHHINIDLLGWWLCERQLPSGGLSGRPEKVDPFHTLFGIAGLSLLGEEQIKAVNPVFYMPENVLHPSKNKCTA